MTEKTIVFVDTETTSLRPDKRFWEVALIVRQPGLDKDFQVSWFVHPNDLDLGNADLAALKFGNYYERHPWYTGSEEDPFAMADGMAHEVDILHTVGRLTRGAVLMGSNPSFDAELLAARMRAHGICPAWHYRVEDVPTMALGWLHGAGKPLPEDLRSDQISLAVGVDPARYERHTALGDCCWTRDLYDAVTGGKPTTTDQA